MLRISKLADYGTVIMVFLAQRTELLSNTREIAKHTHLKVPTVSKLLKRLTAAGLLSSERGVSGGYRLQKSAREISVADILYALEEQQGLVECSSQPNACFLQRFCHVQGNWRLIGQAIDAALHSVSLEHLAQASLSTQAIEHIKELVGHGVGVMK